MTPGIAESSGVRQVQTCGGCENTSDASDFIDGVCTECSLCGWCGGPKREASSMTCDKPDCSESEERIIR